MRKFFLQTKSLSSSCHFNFLYKTMLLQDNFPSIQKLSCSILCSNRSPIPYNIMQYLRHNICLVFSSRKQLDPFYLKSYCWQVNLDTWEPNWVPKRTIQKKLYLWTLKILKLWEFLLGWFCFKFLMVIKS